jgi:CRISPR-associated exonuclease Cas4
MRKPGRCRIAYFRPSGHGSPELLLLALALAVAAYVLLTRWTRSRRRALGITEGKIVSADDSVIRAPTLRSERLGLVGRCDHLLRVGDADVPVEGKPSARRLQQSHILQVGALCLLVQDVYGARPPYGVVVLADGSREPVTSRRSSSVAWCGRWSRCAASSRRVSRPACSRWGQNAEPAATSRCAGTTRPT